MSKSKTAVFSLLEAESASTALFLCENSKDIDIRLTSNISFPDLLQDYINNNDPGLIVLCGITVFYNLRELQSSLNKALAKGNEIVWFNNITDLEYFHQNPKTGLKVINKKHEPLRMMAREFFNFDASGMSPSIFDKLVRSGFPAEIFLLWFADHQSRIGSSLSERLTTMLDKFNEGSLPGPALNWYGQLALSYYLAGQSATVRNVRLKLHSFSGSSNPMLITGRQGTGHEAIAFLSHMLSNRYARPFLHINCAELKENDMEMELFGFDSYEGLGRNRLGLFEKGNTGTIFIQGINMLPLRLQEKLLSKLENRTTSCTMAKKDVLDIRLITSTTSELKSLIDSGEFSRELYCIISEQGIDLPELNLSGNDIDSLYSIAVEKLSKLHPDSDRRLTKDQIATLRTYQWNGNVREFFHWIRHYFHTGLFQKLDKVHSKTDIIEKKEEKTDMTLTLEDHKLEVVKNYYSFHEQNKAHTAKALGVSLNTLKSMLKKAGIK